MDYYFWVSTDIKMYKLNTLSLFRYFSGALSLSKELTGTSNGWLHMLYSRLILCQKTGQ